MSTNFISPTYSWWAVIFHFCMWWQELMNAAEAVRHELSIQKVQLCQCEAPNIGYIESQLFILRPSFVFETNGWYLKCSTTSSTAANRGAEMKTLTEKVKNIGCPGQKWSQCVGLVLDLDVFFLIVLMDWLGGWELATNREKLEARFCLNLLPWGADFAETHWLLNVLQELMSRPSRHPNRFHQFSPSVLPVETLSTL